MRSNRGIRSVETHSAMNSQPAKANRLVLILGLSLGLVCLGFVIMNSRSRRDVENLKSETATLRAELEAANLKVSSGGASDEKRRVPKESLVVESSAPQASATEAAPASAKPESRRRVDAEAMSALVKSPMMQKIMASQTSAVLQMTYANLMNHLQLSQEEREYLQGLLVEKQTSLQNLGMQLMNPGLSGDDRGAIMKQLTEAWKGGEAKIREFLNDEADFAYYQSYTKQEPERKEVGMFEASLTGGDALDPATSDALANLQNEARKKFGFTVDFYNQENFGNPAVLNTAAVQTFLDEQTRFQARVAEKAADLLTPGQLQAFKQNQAAVRQMSGMQLNSIVQMAGGGQ